MHKYFIDSGFSWSIIWNIWFLSTIFGWYAMSDPLYWESPYAIALALREHHPHVDLEGVSLGMIYRWVMELREFQDDPALANDDILQAIYQDWYEEVYTA